MKPEEQNNSENITTKTIVRLVNVIVLLFVLLVFLFVAFLFQRWNKPVSIVLGCGTVSEMVICGGTMDDNRVFLNDPDQANAREGKILFKAHCATCHRFSAKLTGPALEGVFDRVPAPAEEYLFNYIKNEKRLRKQNDKYALKIYNDYNKAAMPSYEFLNDEEIKNIVAYLRPMR